jgi:hypothetical protein
MLDNPSYSLIKNSQAQCPVVYSGCQKNVPVFKRFFLQPLMPRLHISEHYYGKRYKFVLGIFTRWLNSDFRYECQGNQGPLSAFWRPIGMSYKTVTKVVMSLVSGVSVQVSGK